MPPPNDLFANATPITANEWLAGYNSGAGHEPGEPFNNGATVWWAFTPTVSGLYRISTRMSDALTVSQVFGILPPITIPGQGAQQPNAATNFTNFYSKVQVFTGSAVNALTEVPYTTSYATPIISENLFQFESHAYLTNPMEFADLVAFNATAGTTYYIRVDARRKDANGNPLTGNICLTVAGCICAFCTVSPGVGANGSSPFGNFPAGQYTIKYCGGAFIVITGPTPWASVDWGSPTGQGYYVDYNNGNASIRFTSPGGPATYATATEAQAAAKGASVTINHTGGSIALRFFDDPLGDNQSGNPNPSFYILGGDGSVCMSSCPAGISIDSVSVVCDGPSLALQVIVSANGAQFLQTPLQATLFNVQNMNLPTQAIAWATNTTGLNGRVQYGFMFPFSASQSEPIAADIGISVPGGAGCASFIFNEQLNFGLAEAGASISRNGQVYTGTFSISLEANFTCAVLSGCTVALQATGGVSNPSAPVSGVNFSAGQTTTLPFSFTASTTGDITATLNITNGQGQLVAVLNFSIGTYIVASGTNGGCQFTHGGLFQSITVTAQNLGNVASYNVTIGPMNFGTIAAGGQATQTQLVACPPQFTQLPITETAPDGTVINWPAMTLT